MATCRASSRGKADHTPLMPEHGVEAVVVTGAGGDTDESAGGWIDGLHQQSL